MLKLLYFAALVDKLGTASEALALTPELHRVADLVRLLRERGGV